MKSVYRLLFTLAILTAFSFQEAPFKEAPLEDIEFVCLKTHKATNACHFNFKVDGANYCYVDNGCKYNKKKEVLIKKVQEGSLFLAKDWKIPCPEPKPGEGL